MCTKILFLFDSQTLFEKLKAPKTHQNASAPATLKTKTKKNIGGVPFFSFFLKEEKEREEEEKEREEEEKGEKEEKERKKERKKEKREKKKMEKKGLKKEAKMLRIVMECFSTEIFYYESLSLLSSFQEKIRKGKDKKMIENVERIFLNVDDHLGLSFSLLCSLEGVLANFFKRRKERRGEKKWEFIRRERRKEEEGTAEEAEEIVKDLRKVGKIFEEEMNCELAWFAKEKEEEEKEGEERKEIKERKERKERKEEKREEEEEEEEEKDLQLRIGEIYLELLPLMMKEYGIFLSGKYLFQSSLDHLIRSKEPFRSFRTSKVFLFLFFSLLKVIRNKRELKVKK